MPKAPIWSLFICCLLSITARADEAIVSGHWHSLPSKVLAEQRDYAVYLPPGYNAGEARRYPLILVLDGDETRFKNLTGLVGSLSGENLQRQIPESVIVALPNTDRDRDLTPTRVDLSYGQRVLAQHPTSGGADNFAAFIKTELIPTLEKRYRLSGRRLLIGHSYGGLFAGHALLTQPGLFSDYLIIDATYLWHDNYLNRLAKRTLANQRPLKARVYLTLANNDALGEIGVTNQTWGREFIGQLQQRARQSSALNVDFRYFDKESHGTVAMLSWYYGLRKLMGQQDTAAGTSRPAPAGDN